MTKIKVELTWLEFCGCGCGDGVWSNKVTIGGHVVENDKKAKHTVLRMGRINRENLEYKWASMDDVSMDDDY